MTWVIDYKYGYFTIKYLRFFIIFLILIHLCVCLKSSIVYDLEYCTTFMEEDSEIYRSPRKMNLNHIKKDCPQS